MKLRADKRGAVALIAGIMAPVMVMALAMGIEVAAWSVTTTDLQRIADVSAWAGAAQYVLTANARSATQSAADVAEINGVAGAATRMWNAATATTTDGLITAQIVAGIKNASDIGIRVTVSKSVAKTFSLIFPSPSQSMTISATAMTEIASVPSGPQPCLLALNGDDTGITTGLDITLTGSANITANNCSVRSNAGISLSGASSLNVGGTYAGGAITTSGSATITGGIYANAGQVMDPYRAYAPLVGAFSSLGVGGAPGTYGGSTRATIGPGTYSSLNFDAQAVITMRPGTYIVNGNVSFGGAAQISGSGVTIISSGTISNSGSGTVSLSAPLLNSVNGGIPGVLFASQSTLGSQFAGSTSLPFSGLIYYPNGNLKFTGSATIGTNGCSQVIAGTLTISGASNLAANCAAYGTLSYGSLPNASSIALVR